MSIGSARGLAFVLLCRHFKFQSVRLHFALPTSRHLRRITVIRLSSVINKADFILTGFETFSGTDIVVFRFNRQLVAASCTQRHSKEVNPARHARNSPAQSHGQPLATLSFEFSFQAAPYLRAIPQQFSTIKK